jgi:hypothetical protein
VIVMAMTAGGTAACVGDAVVGVVGNVDDVFPPHAPIPMAPMAKLRAKGTNVGL